MRSKVPTGNGSGDLHGLSLSMLWICYKPLRTHAFDLIVFLLDHIVGGLVSVDKVYKLLS